MERKDSMEYDASSGPDCQNRTRMARGGGLALAHKIGVLMSRVFFRRFRKDSRLLQKECQSKTSTCGPPCICGSSKFRFIR